MCKKKSEEINLLSTKLKEYYIIYYTTKKHTTRNR